MKIDWHHPDVTYPIDFFDPQSVSGTNTWQYVAALPKTLADIRTGKVHIYTDADDGTRYVRCEGSLYIEPIVDGDPYPDEVHPPSYFPYRFQGWPVIAALPGDLFNAEVSAGDPAYEYGGRFIESGMFAKYDENDYGTPPTIPWWRTDFDPPLDTQFPFFRLGNTGPGGINFRGYKASNGVTPRNSWVFKAVSQRCWVLLLISPAAPDGGLYVGGLDPVVSVPRVISPHDRFDFDLIWKAGPGSRIPGTGTGLGGAQGDVPSTVTIEE